MNRLLLEYISKILHEYTDAEKRQIGIPPNAEARGRWWYVGDTYAGRVEGGRFIPAGVDGVGPSGPEDKKEKPATSRGTSPELRKDVPVSQEVSSADYLAAQGVFPEVREISVVDEIDHDTIQQLKDDLSIDDGDPDLPSDMGNIEEGYANKSLEGDYSDDQYYDRAKSAGLEIRHPLYKVPGNFVNQLLARGFSMQYIQLIERAINTERKGEEPKFSDMMPGVGAGMNQSQFGEIMSMAMIALPPESRQSFADELVGVIGTDAQQKKGLIIPVATRSWVTSAIGHAEAFDTHMNELYGKNGWRLEATAWDRKTDIESIGLDYKNKGFSTDVILRVQPLDEGGKPIGSAKAQRASLKKDENVMLFNGGLGEIRNLVRQGYLTERENNVYGILSKIKQLLNSKISTERGRGLDLLQTLSRQTYKNVREAKEKVTGILDNLDSKARERAPERVRDVLDRITNFSETQKESAVQLMVSVFGDDSLMSYSDREIDDVIKAEFSSDSDRKFVKACWNAIKACKNEGVAADGLEGCMAEKMKMAQIDRISKMGTFLGKLASRLDPPGYSKKIQEHIDLATQLGADYLSIFSSEHPEMLGGLLGVLAEKFPLKVVMSGTEFMVINGVHIGPETMKTMFGTESYEDLQLGLKIMMIDNTPMLVYQATSNRDPVVIGTVAVRQRGLGYNPVGFEIKCADEFVLRAGVANLDNNHTSPSNDQAVKRIGVRLDRRRSRGGN